MVLVVVAAMLDICSRLAQSTATEGPLLSLTGIVVVPGNSNDGAQPMADSNFQQFKLAIKGSGGRPAVQGSYDSESAVRKLWPLVLGRTGSVEMVLCYQYDVVGGDSPQDSDPLKNLRCFKVGQFKPTTLERIEYDGGGEPPVLDFDQVKKQTCVAKVEYLRQPD